MSILYIIAFVISHYLEIPILGIVGLMRIAFIYSVDWWMRSATGFIYTEGVHDPNLIYYDIDHKDISTFNVNHAGYSIIAIAFNYGGGRLVGEICMQLLR